MKLTSGGRPAANIHVIFVIELYSNSFAVSSRDAATSAAAQRDGHDAIDVREHDGNTDA